MGVWRRISVWEMMLLIILFCAGCTSSPVSEVESPDITLARQHFFQDGRIQLVNWIKASSLPTHCQPDCSVAELEKSELGNPIPVWRFKRGSEPWQVEFSPEEQVTNQIVSADTYLFPVLVKERIVADYQASVEKGKITGSSCSLDKCRYAYDVAKANVLDLQQCYLVVTPGENMFLFSIVNDKEICSGELGVGATSDLTMNETNVESFKSRVASFNLKTQVPTQPLSGENGPLGKAPPFDKGQD